MSVAKRAYVAFVVVFVVAASASAMVFQLARTSSSELVDYADHHSGTMATSPGRLNPYKLGIELFRDIEERWNKGQFGPEYEECDHFETRRRWDKKVGLARGEILAEGDYATVSKDPKVVEAYLGTAHA